MPVERCQVAPVGDVQSIVWYTFGESKNPSLPMHLTDPDEILAPVRVLHQVTPTSRFIRSLSWRHAMPCATKCFHAGRCCSRWIRLTLTHDEGQCRKGKCYVQKKEVGIEHHNLRIKNAGGWVELAHLNGRMGIASPKGLAGSCPEQVLLQRLSLGSHNSTPKPCGRNRV